MSLGLNELISALLARCCVGVSGRGHQRSCGLPCGEEHPSTVVVWNHGKLGLLEAAIILYMHTANKRRRYIVTSSLIGWAHIENDLCGRYIQLPNSRAGTNKSVGWHIVMRLIKMQVQKYVQYGLFSPNIHVFKKKKLWFPMLYIHMIFWLLTENKSLCNAGTNPKKHAGQHKLN